MIEYNKTIGFFRSLIWASKSQKGELSKSETLNFIQEHFKDLTGELSDMSQVELVSKFSWVKKKFAGSEEILNQFNAAFGTLSKKCEPAKPVMKRQLSTPRLFANSSLKVEESLKEAKNSDQSLWNCILCEHDTYAGYKYTFAFKTFDSETIEKKTAAAFPAVEVTPVTFRHFFTDRIVEMDHSTGSERVKSLGDRIAANVFLEDMDCGFKDDSRKYLQVPSFMEQKNICSALNEDLELEGKEIFDLDLIERLLDYDCVVKAYHGMLEGSSEPGFDFGVVRDLKVLGFDCKQIGTELCIVLPDREALLSRWSKLREDNSFRNLPELHIASSDGVADDMSFVAMALSHDLILSTGVEFVHDMTIHALAVLSSILSESFVDTRMSDFHQGVRRAYQFYWSIEGLLEDPTIELPPILRETWESRRKMIQATLGANIDSDNASVGSYGFPSVSIRDGNYPKVWEESNWQGYWNKRFSDAPLTDDGVREFIGIFQELEVISRDIQTYIENGRRH